MGGISFDLTGKCCVVTGAARGLGRHMAGVLADHGARVFGISDITPDDCEADGQVQHMMADVTDTSAITDLIAQIEDEAGPVACWINNAGKAYPSKARAVDAAELADLLAVNTIAPSVLGDLVASRMKEHGVAGSIINVSSVLGETVLLNAPGYGASKVALEVMTRKQARSWGRDGIRFNAIAPGWMRTPLTQDFFDKGFEAVLRGQIPLRRVGDPDDLDGALLLLASDSSRYITGATIRVDGGLSC